MSSSFSKLHKFFSNWIVHFFSLIICGGLIYYIFIINKTIEFHNVRGINDLINISITSPGKFFAVLGATLLLFFLAFFIVPITYKRFFKVYIIIPIILMCITFIGYYIGYGLQVFLINIVILIISIIIISVSILLSLPSNKKTN